MGLAGNAARLPRPQSGFSQDQQPVSVDEPNARLRIEYRYWNERPARPGLNQPEDSPGTSCEVVEAHQYELLTTDGGQTDNILRLERIIRIHERGSSPVESGGSRCRCG